ncbi:thioesterase II family protein [Paracidovorax citrulli]|uniref:Thioesterase n=2 Tax=Paracidovorax citrulli TaxID=80869 RepID=A1TTJ4_PARC0|nr:Thioesterase [Paracidovorax citrulli AAC00-1]ATG93770.1 thioesterase [Paracidovorax citrulli]PVY63726.1 surfactin synthase thioesterase subunit [Paracidovorax citrulli]QCX09704.1 Linear gramicidin dehydrogenase LgrE [Paracidovorax citrulli]REG67309.1 surfactin synthase thioesterase subunit [Paracidovorax citrulli]
MAMASDADLVLLCLPCAGASATMYLRWQRRLPPGMRVVPVELPGRGARMGEPFARSYADLVGPLAEGCLRAAGGAAFALFGHSMGALLAYGVACRMAALGGAVPAALAVSACAAPALRSGERYAEPLDDARLIADLREQGGTPEAVFAEPELLRITLDVLRADYRLCHGFRRPDDVEGAEGTAPLSCPVHIFGGRADRIAAAELQAWARETRGPSTLDWFGGGHFFLREEEDRFLRTLAARMTAPGAARGARSLAATA